MKTWTHAQLVTRAARWLRNTFKCRFSFEEFPVCTGEIPDAIGWRANGRSAMIECKTSRADFLRDKDKVFRKTPGLAVGAERYYMVSDAGIIKTHELPEDWGLLLAKGNTVEVLRAARPRKDLRSDYAKSYELRMLIGALNRVAYRLQPASLTDWMRFENQEVNMIEMISKGEELEASPELSAMLTEVSAEVDAWHESRRSTDLYATPKEK